MSIESASKFIASLYEHDGDALSLLPKGVKVECIGAKEIALIAAAANAAGAAGWDFTADELQEAYLDSLTIDEEELATVAGGCPQPCPHVAQEPKHLGGCTTNYFAEECLCDVDNQSGCNCTDLDAKQDYYHKVD